MCLNFAKIAQHMCKHSRVKKKEKETSLAHIKTEFRKKKNPLKIVLSSRVASYNDIQKNNSFIFSQN